MQRKKSIPFKANNTGESLTITKNWGIIFKEYLRRSVFQMRITEFHRLWAVVLAVAMLCCTLSGCIVEEDGTLNVMFDSLYVSSGDTFVNDAPAGDMYNLPESGITLDELMASLNEQRKNDVRTTISDSSIFLPDYESDEFQAVEFSEEELELLTDGENPVKDILTYEDAEMDVDYLFRLLKTSYAPYEYFGGDETFNKAKENILSSLESLGNKIESYELESIIVEELNFVTDSHFSLNYSDMEFDEEVYYYDRDLREYRIDDKGYFTVIGGVKYYVDGDYDRYIRLTVGKTGELVYAFIALCEEGNKGQLPNELVLVGENGEELEITINWKKDSYSYASRLTWEDNVDGIPLTGIGAMMVDDDYYIGEMNDFVNNAKKLRDEDVFILDLRGNMGGLSTISFMWLYNLTKGHDVEGEYTMVYYMSMLNELVTQGNNDEFIDALLKFDFFEENPELKDELLESEEDVQGEGYVYDTEDSWVEYDGTVLVLCDKAVSSAGEMFLLELMDVENVVIFGTNSNGCLISGGTNYYVPVYLPNSGISVYYSTILVLTDDSENFDARGIQPDVVICGEDEAEAAARCWNYYNHRNA